jgi:uncharacterized protein (TIGR01777 family)
MAMKKVLITGGTGLVGTRLTTLLTEKGFEIMLLSRNPKPLSKIKQYRWDISKNFIEPAAIEDADYIVHLAGESIAEKPWTNERKKQLLESRTKSSEVLYTAIKAYPNKIKAVIAATATGYYGNSGNELVTEESPAGKGFLTDVCEAWEKASQPFADITRLVQLRIGIVLSTQGGALVELQKPINFGLGAYIGNGNQYYSWIHIDDLCGIIIHAIENEEMKGVYNAVAPNATRNRDLVDSIRFALKKPSIGIPSPEFVIKMLMGEMAAVVLDSCKASAQKIIQAGYEFKFKTPSPALHDLYKRKV